MTASHAGAADRPAAATAIGDLRPQARADVAGVIRSARAMSIGGTPACRYTLTDGTGELDLLFLGRVEIAGLEPGRRCRAEGMAATRDDRIVLWNPRYRLEPRVGETLRGGQHSHLRGLDAGSGDTDPALSPQAGRVLVVDDDPAIRRVLRVTLTRSGYEVDLAASGAAAIELASRCPDLIILDLGLPDISGLRVISSLRAECDAPIIAISAREAVSARLAALAAGASDYLAKPFGIDSLLAKMREPEAEDVLADDCLAARG